MARILFRISLSICALILMSPTVGSGCQSEEKIQAEDPMFEDGAIGPVRKPLHDFLKLKYKSDKLSIDRDVWNKKYDKGKLEKELTAQMAARGLPERHVKMMVEARMRQQNSPIQRAFAGVTAAVGGGRSSSISNGHVQITARGRNLNASLIVADEKVKFSIVENVAPSRELTIREEKDGRTSVLITGLDSVVKFDQKEDGAVRLIWVSGEKVSNVGAKSFDEVSSKHTEQCERLFQLLEHWGVDAPPLASSVVVKSAAMDRLVSLSSNVAAELNALLDKLDAKSFKDREAATEKLTLNYERYSDAINTMINDPDLSPEVVRRLKEVAEKNTNYEMDSVRNFLDEQKLLESYPFLINLFADANEKEADAIAAQLQKLSGEDFGIDAEAWTDWAKENKN